MDEALVVVRSIEDVAPYCGEHAIPGIRFRALRSAMGVTAWGMNVMDLDPSCEGYPEHDHSGDGQEEVYLVLSGEVTLVTPDGERRLRTGELARVAPSVRRKLVTREVGARILALGATPGVAFTPSL